LPGLAIEARDAVEWASLVRSGQVQPAELVEAAIARLEKVNPVLNAVITPMYDEAKALIGRLDRSLPLAGVPCLLKDLDAPFAGTRLANGNRLLRDARSTQHARIVQRMLAAGLIPIGKTNVPEFGYVPTTEPVAFGPTRNPWDLARTPGGSSGGSAAAVAAGITPLAHASDGGGSIRIPASCCGVFGLKPTRARTPIGHFAATGLVVEFAVTRTVRDAAVLLDCLSGYATGDPYTAPQPLTSYQDALDTRVRRLRVAVVRDSPVGRAVSAECTSAVQSTADVLVSLGHEVKEVQWPFAGEPFEQAFICLWTTDCANTVRELARHVGRYEPDIVEPLTWAMHEHGLRYSSVDFLGAIDTLLDVTARMGTFLCDCDVVLTPTTAHPAPPLGWLAQAGADPLSGLWASAEFSAFTAVCNATGQPAMSVPLHWTSAGIPIGVQFIGPYGDEATLIQLAAELEQACPWGQRGCPL
jgi:amidase